METTRGPLSTDHHSKQIALRQRHSTPLQGRRAGFGVDVPNDGFRILAADHTETGISLGSVDGQSVIESLLADVDLLILDNLSTLCTTGSESASDAWVPMQNWLIGLCRKGIAVLLIHHAGVNGRQCGTSRREDALDTVIALRRPEDYSPEQGARLEIHFEKLRNRVDGDGAVSFEAKLESLVVNGREGALWSDHDLSPPVFKQAIGLFQDGLTVREVAAALHISKTEAGRLRLRALDEGLLATGNGAERATINGNGHDAISIAIQAASSPLR